MDGIRIIWLQSSSYMVSASPKLMHVCDNREMNGVFVAFNPV